MSARAARSSWLVLALIAACGGAQRPEPGRVEHGLASWYGGKLDGSMTASGERFDQDAMTAAHRTLPFGTVVRVVNLKNDRSVTVRINDRGPYGRGRIIDVSRAAARALDMIVDGVVKVTVEVVRLPH
jgi:peptidoglycan lytic transglycosylase